jgi:TPR repeat protein
VRSEISARNILINRIELLFELWDSVSVRHEGREMIKPSLLALLGALVLFVGPTLSFAQSDTIESQEIRQLRAKAESGDVAAQYLLALRYDEGLGVSVNDIEAVKWYRKAADRGIATAQVNLGMMYYNGEGVPKDDAEAVRWYRKAAERGNPNAQFSLGFMYSNGKGLAEDDIAAVNWYRKSSEQGQPYAQFNLGLMYYNGDGVPKNNVEAYFWWNLAAARGLPSSEIVANAKTNRDRLENEMTREQIADAQRRSAAWKPKKE